MTWEIEDKDIEACEYGEGHVAYTAINDLGICGCGWHDVFVAEVLNVLRTLRDKGSLFDNWTMLHPDGFGNYGAELLLNVMDNAGLLEHGTSIAGSWATDKGKRLLEIMDDKPADWLDDCPGFACSQCPDKPKSEVG